MDLEEEELSPIVITGFAGAALDPNPRTLSEQVGVSVVDAEPGAGVLRPLHAALQVATVPALVQAQTIYLMPGGYWLSWPTRVSVIRDANGTDTTDRIYYTGDGVPKWTNNVIGLAGGPPYPQAARLFAVPKPSTALTVALHTDGTGTDGRRFYVATFVNDLGWESAPGPVSAGLDCKTGAIVDLTNLPTVPTGNYGITRIRIYATSPGTVATAAAPFLFLREVAAGTSATQDDARTLGDALATVGWLPLPDTAHSLIDLWNGMAAALDGKTLLISESNSIYAFKVANDQEIRDKPVALAKWEQNLLVLTEAAPRVFFGQDATSFSEAPFRVGFACSSARGVVGFDHGVLWPSGEGLASTGSEALLTKGVVSPDQWKSMTPATMVAGRWRSMYVCSYEPAGGGARKGFIFDPLHPERGIWFLSTGFDACHYDALADELYVLEGGNVKRFNGSATKLVASFKSKAFRQMAPRNFGYAKVVADSYPLTLKVYAGGVLKRTRTVTDDKPFRLPGGFRKNEWQAEVANDDDTVAVHLAADIEDLR